MKDSQDRRIKTNKDHRSLEYGSGRKNIQIKTGKSLKNSKFLLKNERMIHKFQAIEIVPVAKVTRRKELSVAKLVGKIIK